VDSLKTRLNNGKMTKLTRLENRAHLFGVDIDLISMKETVKIIGRWLALPEKGCKFVVTPNVDHIVKVQTDIALQAAYKQAALVVTDGKPVVWAASLLGVKIPGTVPGSDLVPAIFDYAQFEKTPVKVFLLGAMPGVADRAKIAIHNKWPLVNVVGTLSPDFGFDKSEIESKAICEIISSSGAELLVLGLGAPKQELWITRYAPRVSVKVALCVGATIDFLAGEKARAPMWMRRVGLEWLHRMLSEPQRLAKRYFIDAIVFPKLIFKEWCQRHGA
jgi:N-acetylglucosaminyldiphosphoundecaprenol N-acetyl-beta-D-mannosaminyltransferase